MEGVRERVRVVIGRFGSSKVAQVLGISELMVLKVGANAVVRAEVLAAVAANLGRLEGEDWATEITAVRRSRPDVSVSELTEREVLVRNAILADVTLCAIVQRPAETARDLSRLYPTANLVGEVERAGSWLRGDERRAKVNGRKFLENWCKKERPVSRPTLVPAPTRDGIYGRSGPAQPAVASSARRWKPAAPPPEESGLFADRKTG